MKRARPRNKKAAQKMMRQRELEYLRRQREERDLELAQRIEEAESTEPGVMEPADSVEAINDAPVFESESVYTPDDAYTPDEVYEEEQEEYIEEEIPELSCDEPEEYDEADLVEAEDEEDDLLDEDETDDDVDESEEDIEEAEDSDDSEDDVEDEDDFDDSQEAEPMSEADDFEADDQRERTDIDLDLPGKQRKKGGCLKVLFKTLISAMLVVIVLVFVTLGFGLFDDTQILAPLENGKINVLLMGVDDSGLRTDAVMVATYDVNEGKINMLSIPRDTKIFVKNRRMTRKINEIHAIGSNGEPGFILGTQAMAETVQTLTGIPINYYVEFSFASIDHLFDILGPVEFDVPDVEGNGEGMNYDDPYQNLHIHLKPGLQKLSGNQIQQFLRYRKSNSGKGTGSDTDRVLRQQEFVKAVIDQKVNLSTLLKLPSIYSQISSEIRTNISLNDITKYVRYLNKLTGEGITTYSLPGEAKNVGGGSYFVANLEETKKLMSEVFGVEGEVSDTVTLSETNAQKPLKVTYVSATPTPEPTPEPTEEPTPEATKEPTPEPTKKPEAPTKEPTKAPEVTKEPTKAPQVTKEPEDEIIIL